MIDIESVFPHTAALELTYRCNHSCIFCSCPWEDDDTYKQSELSLQEWYAVIDQLIKYGVNYITLTGGEPLTRSDLRNIIEYIHLKNIRLNMISNGRKIDDDFLDFIAENDVAICISVPGVSTFKDQTGIDNIGHVLSLFDKAHERKIQVTANIAVTKKNLPELYENIAYPLLHGADYVLLNRFLPGGRGLRHTEFLLSLEETNEMLDQYSIASKTMNDKSAAEEDKLRADKILTSVYEWFEGHGISKQGVETYNHIVQERTHKMSVEQTLKYINTSLS